MRGLVTALVLITVLGSGCKDDTESARSGDAGLAGDGAGSGGSGGSGDGGASDSLGGVPGGKRLGELTQDETVDLCEGLHSTVDTTDTRRGSCVIAASFAVSAASAGQAAQVCQTQIDACLGAPAEPCAAMMFTEDCQVTVAELASCLRTAAEQLAALSQKSCDDIVAEAADDGDGGVTTQLENELSHCSEMLNVCSASADDACCADGDPCGYGGNGFCDCADQSWDDADCK